MRRHHGEARNAEATSLAGPQGRSNPRPPLRYGLAMTQASLPPLADGLSLAIAEDRARHAVAGSDAKLADGAGDHF